MILGNALAAHFDFLSRTLQTHGLPLALSVDYHSFFYTHNPDAFTQLGAALHCCGIQLRSVPTPQAKGKIERRHDDGQKRLVPLLAADRIVELTGPTNGSTNSSRTLAPLGKKTPADSPFRLFDVHGLKCGSYQITLQAEFDEGRRDLVLLLVCAKCRQQEPIRQRAG